MTYPLRAALAAAFLAAWPAAAAAQITEISSVDSNGVLSGGQSGNLNTLGPSVSDDGTLVAFWSSATNLVPGDNNGVRDIFVRDHVAGTTERVSVDSAGFEADGESLGPRISGDGRYVAFSSLATNLYLGDVNGKEDVFRHDRVTKETLLVSISAGLTQSDGDSLGPALSADGNLVVFWSHGSGLVPGDTNGVSDVFLADIAAGTLIRVSVDSLGGEADGNSRAPVMTPDGAFVVYESLATNLVPGDTNGFADVFRWERATGAVTRLSLAFDGSEANLDCQRPAVSADGSVIAFHSKADNLVPGDTNVVFDVFVRDLTAGTFDRVSVDVNGVEGNAASRNPSLSANGRFVAFWGSASTLVPSDPNGGIDDIFRKDRVTGEVVLLSVDPNAQASDGDSAFPYLSADGTRVTYTSNATNLVPGDTNGKWDVFLTDSVRPAPFPTFCTSKTLLVCGPAAISASGAPSMTQTSGFTVSAGPVRGCRPGLLLYSNQPTVAAAPFGGPGDGVLCLLPQGLRRAGPVDSGGTGPLCDGVFSIDMNTFSHLGWTTRGCNSGLVQTNPAGFLLNPGTTVNAQFWGRDSVGSGQVVSDGVTWVVGP